MRFAALALIAALAGACTDPGCIRNSECPIDFRCIEAACVRASTDAGTGPAAAVDGSAPVTTDASTSRPNPTGEDAGQ